MLGMWKIYLTPFKLIDSYYISSSQGISDIYYIYNSHTFAIYFMDFWASIGRIHSEVPILINFFFIRCHAPAFPHIWWYAIGFTLDLHRFSIDEENSLLSPSQQSKLLSVSGSQSFTKVFLLEFALLADSQSICLVVGNQALH